MLLPQQRFAHQAGVYVGQVERDEHGALWAVLYYGRDVVSREQVPTLRRGRRRVTDLVLAAADAFPGGPPIPYQQPGARDAQPGSRAVDSTA